MVKVNLPKVEEETRAELNIIKARRKEKSLNETLDYLISLDENGLDLTYDEVRTIIEVLQAVNGEKVNDDFKENCISGSQKLYRLMKRMEEKEGMRR